MDYRGVFEAKRSAGFLGQGKQMGVDFPCFFFHLRQYAPALTAYWI